MEPEALTTGVAYNYLGRKLFYRGKSGDQFKFFDYDANDDTFLTRAQVAGLTLWST